MAALLRFDLGRDGYPGRFECGEPAGTSEGRSQKFEQPMDNRREEQMDYDPSLSRC